MDFGDIWDEDASDGELREKLNLANVMLDSMSSALQEAYADSARAMLSSEDVGWVRLGVTQSSITQITLQDAKAISKKLHEYGESNPLLTRGKEVRCSYLFSSGYQIGTEDAKSKISQRILDLINSEKNQAAVFGPEALERVEGERYAAGQTFHLFDRATTTFQQISFQEIADIIYNPEDPSEIWYVRRDWTATVITAQGATQQQDFQVYYPSSKYDGGKSGYAATINNKRVDDTKRMVVDRVNVQPGGNLGIPDSFAAAPWALAYSSYLSDGSKVLAALAEWAWLVKPKKRNPAERAAATVRNERGAGGTLFTDMDVQAMPTSNAVDLNTGRPLAAQVASALGISVVLLLADPGQSGAYGTAQTLSDPNRRTMEARRERNTEFLKHCLSLMGVKDPAITWPKMAPGSDSDEMSIVAQAWGSGLFDGETEIRPRMAELAHIELKSDTAPEGWLTPNNANTLKKTAEASATNDAQGDVHQDGSTSQSNGQGRDSQKVGNAKKSGTGKTNAPKD